MILFYLFLAIGFEGEGKYIDRGSTSVMRDKL